jgi:hypothetical protein
VSAQRPELDPGRILSLLVAADVDFVVIGGIAAVLHGSALNTFDLDVCFATDAENLTRLGNVLTELRAYPRGVEPGLPFVPDAETLRKVELLTLRTSAGDFDVLARPKGVSRYATLRDRAEVFDLGGFTVRVAAIEDLMAMKQAAGREKDLAAIGELEAILRLRA